jgi:ABC-2 type transport system ATP-binding protein
MRLILGLDAPTAGTVALGGVAYRRLRRPLHDVGAMLEAAAVHPGRRARAHLVALARSNAIPVRRVDEVLGLVGLDTVADRRVGTFSLGMTQRLGVAGALLGDPGVLLLDEPVNGLDPEGVAWIRGLLRALAAEGRTVFVSSHLMAEMALTADRLVVIGRGRLIADTTVDQFVASAASLHVLVRSSDQERLRAALRAAGAEVQPDADDSGALVVAGLAPDVVGRTAFDAGVVVHELTPQLPSLEEAFMKMTADSVEFHAAPEEMAHV